MHTHPSGRPAHQRGGTFLGIVIGVTTVIIISSEYPELLAVSDRVLVLRDGSVTQDLARTDIKDEEMLQLAVQGVGR